MSSRWLFIRHPALPSAENMAWDEALLETAAGHQQPLLRFYGWAEPAATFGYFQRILDVESMTPLRPLVRRPTGGGLVPHDADWTYSVSVPPGDSWYALRAIESYRRIHDWIRLAFERIEVSTALSPTSRREAPGRCFVGAGAEQFDLLLNKKKIAGAAQRRTLDGLLIQGSIQAPPGADRLRFETAMMEVVDRIGAGADGGAAWEEFQPGAALLGRVRELAATKYSQDDYNRRR
jgi:lipoate-protein ligase A